jgi:hypothetical protein
MNKIDLIIDALELARKFTNEFTALSQINKALTAAKELQALKPVAWMCPYKYDITDTSTQYVLDHAQDGKDHMLSRLDHADVDGWRGEPIALYALDEVTK